MNVGECGNYIRINVNEDIQLNTNTLILKSPAPVIRTKELTSADGLVVGTTDINVGDKTFKAGQYVEYRIKSDDIFLEGIWLVRLKSNTADGTVCKITDYSGFTVIK